uniref:protein-tyrosine-phosphatase n=1 Tax=Monosiga ovata TaxID=81526 RepID=E5RKE2_9EUKA|nr:protein tyrosine phosphatase [Monosiga ovata]
MDVAALIRSEQFLTHCLNTLEQEVRQLSAKNNEGFLIGFNNIEAIPGARSTVSTKPENKRCNRYNNIIAYDHSRVKVTPCKANGNNDYINGNFLKGADGKETYIATQAPVPEAFYSFWQMVWEQGITTIVMVTNEVEGGKLKCHRYWPDGESKEAKREFQDLVVQYNLQEVLPTHVKRSFTVTHKKSGQTRDVTQFAFTAWPDHGVPSTTQELLDFRTEVRKSWSHVRGKLLVHCSAGVGRTGTFIALDSFFQGIETGSYNRIYDIVANMRADRNFMVQSQIQFIYLYHICLDGVHDMLMTVRKALRSATLSDYERHQDTLEDIQELVDEAAELLDDEIDDGEDALDEEYRRDPSKFAKPLEQRKKKKAIPGIKPHARHDDGKYTDDIGRAARISASQRRSSLLEIGGTESEFWRSRKNVPLSLQEKGYAHPSLRDLGQRVQSLEDYKTAWRRRYEQAFQRWKEVQDEGGEVYDITRQMTPLESRLESLANMEDAWKFRGDGFRSSREEDVRRTLASLEKRLQSLQETILSNEARWRTKGDGMRQRQEVPDGVRINTTDKLGGLLERLKLLQEEEVAWVKRDNLERFDRSKFERDISKERSIQENAQLKREQEEQAQRDAEALAARLRLEDDQRLQQLARERQLVKEREQVKEKIREKSVREASYDPERERLAKQKQKDDEERAAKEAQAKVAQKKQDEIAQAEAKKKQAEAAKSQAERFLGKMKQ